MCSTSDKDDRPVLVNVLILKTSLLTILSLTVLFVIPSPRPWASSRACPSHLAPCTSHLAPLRDFFVKFIVVSIAD